MIELINSLLSVDDFFGKSERIDIAKGKYELTTNIRKIWKQNKRNGSSKGNNNKGK